MASFLMQHKLLIPLLVFSTACTENKTTENSQPESFGQTYLSAAENEQSGESEVHVAENATAALGDSMVAQEAEDLQNALQAYEDLDEIMQEESQVTTERIRSHPDWPGLYQELLRQCLAEEFYDDTECERRAQVKADRDVFR